MTTIRALAAGAVAAALWALTALLSRLPGGPRPLGWIENVVVPGPLVRIGELPVPWPYVIAGAGAVLIGTLVAGAALLAPGATRVPIVWLALALGSLVVGAVMGVGTIIGEAPRLGVSYPIADVAQALGSQAWGLLLGWIPALVAGWSRERAAARPAIVATLIVAIVATLVTATGAAIGGPARFAALETSSAAPPSAAPTPGPSVSFSPGPVPADDYALATTTCAPGSLILGPTGGSGALGHRDFAIEVRNASATACTLEGYPGIGFRDARGRGVAATITPGRSFMDDDPGAAPVTLAAGGTAVATFGWDAGAESGDPTTAKELALRVHAGSARLTVPSPAFDVVRGTAVTVQAWHAGVVDPG